MNKMTENGVTTTSAPGQEQYQFWTDSLQRRRCMYDYRHPDGELFCCNGKTLEKCRDNRNAWLKSRNEKKKLQVMFAGIDSWGRPVFKAIDKKGYIGDVYNLFMYEDEEDTVLDFYKDKQLNECLIYFGSRFGCEPEGDPLENVEIEIIAKKQRGNKNVH